MIVKKVAAPKTKHKTASIRDLADYIREPHNQNPDEKGAVRQRARLPLRQPRRTT